MSAKGIGPEQRKVDAVMNARAPKTPGEVRSFLGLANYRSRFIADYATVSEPLRKLTRSNTKWEWTEVQKMHLKSSRKDWSVIMLWRTLIPKPKHNL